MSREVRATDEAKQLAEQYEIDLRLIKGTGPDGLITLKDVEEYIKEHFLPKVKRKYRLVGVRKVIARRLGKSYREAIHVTLNTEVRTDEFIKYREVLAKKLGGSKPSYTLMIAKCVAKALKEYPRINATIEGDEVTEYDTVNMNIAVDTPIGLLTPVIREVFRRGINELMRDYADVIERARRGKLKERDIIGGTFTITNLGMFGIDTFTPIINPPQVAILGVNRMVKKVVPTEEGGLEVATVMNLSLTFDHRVIDGAEAARFLSRIKHYIEHPEEVNWFGEGGKREG